MCCALKVKLYVVSGTSGCLPWTWTTSLQIGRTTNRVVAETMTPLNTTGVRGDGGMHVLSPKLLWRIVLSQSKANGGISETIQNGWHSMSPHVVVIFKVMNAHRPFLCQPFQYFLFGT